ncbi:TetR/AcrR family transcriptional regulator [Streptosporangium sp. NPDC000396]|uniref:TetR/AcrR family transcriptional regulator n=1 Tax=Streptosporangium sp. NPDC000396 TaxID=3366185 RepID=UPI0036898141
MGRPPQHDVDRLLDAAARLAAEAGPRNVTVTAVAREAGAPSGSVYHRFPSRSALLSGLWLRTVERFQEGFLAAASEEPPAQAALAAAGHAVGWCRENPVEARILLYGPKDFDEPNWPAEARERLKQSNRRIEDAIHELAGRLGRDTPRDVELLVLAIVDLPYATVRRHCRAGTPIPGYVEDLVAQCAATLIAQLTVAGR